MESNRYFGRNGELCSVDKETLRNIIDPLKPRSFIKFLEEMDIPFFEDEWIRILETTLNRGGNLKFVIGKYIALMNLKGFRPFVFTDSRYNKDVVKYRIKVEQEFSEEAEYGV